MVRRLVRGFAAAIGVAVMTAACSSGGGSPSGSASAPSLAAPVSLTATPATGDPLIAQATAVLARWGAQVSGSDPAEIVLLGDLSGQIGDWEEAVGGNNKAALMVGLVKAAGALPDDPVADGKVRWADGRSQSVEVLTAAAAFAEILADAEGDCGSGCVPVVLGNPVLGTADVQTARGPATVPAWLFSVEGSSVVVTRPAIAKRAHVVLPPWDAENPPPGLSIEGAIGGPDQSQLVVSFVGAPGPASQPCGADYTAEGVETALAIAVIVREHPHTEGEACRAIGARRTAIVSLAAPLGDRVVLEIREGRPVPVSAK